MSFRTTDDRGVLQLDAALRWSKHHPGARRRQTKYAGKNDPTVVWRADELIEQKSCAEQDGEHCHAACQRQERLTFDEDQTKCPFSNPDGRAKDSATHENGGRKADQRAAGIVISLMKYQLRNDNCHSKAERQPTAEAEQRAEVFAAFRRLRGCVFQRDQIRIPTTQAAISEAMAPPAMASRPMRDRSARREGAMVLMPPTWIPTLAKLAKPHRA